MDIPLVGFVHAHHVQYPIPTQNMSSNCLHVNSWKKGIFVQVYCENKFLDCTFSETGDCVRFKMILAIDISVDVFVDIDYLTIVSR